MNLLDKAIRISAVAFEGCFDKQGQPYILHCLNVMNQMPEEDCDLRCIAVLHDLVEDTNWTISMLEEEGFSKRVLIGVELMTHDKETSYEDYVKKLSTNSDCRKVKMADLRHNSDIRRMKSCARKDFERLEKYCNAYNYLKEMDHCK